MGTDEAPFAPLCSALWPQLGLGSDHFSVCITYDHLWVRHQLWGFGTSRVNNLQTRANKYLLNAVTVFKAFFCNWVELCSCPQSSCWRASAHDIFVRVGMHATCICNVCSLVGSVCCRTCVCNVPWIALHVCHRELEVGPEEAKYHQPRVIRRTDPLVFYVLAA